MNDIWIVIPAYNEAPRLGRTLDAVCRRYANVVVVDDGSCDDTYAVAMRRPACVLRHAINCGQGAALQTGIDFALAHGADTIVTFDADGQHNVDDIARLAAAVGSGTCDVALGSRFLGWTVDVPWGRWLLLKAAVLFTRVVSRIAVTDTHNGLRAFSRRAALQIRLRENRMAHASEILHQIRKLGLRFQEVPVTIRYTRDSLAKGQTSWNAVSVAGQFLLGRLIP